MKRRSDVETVESKNTKKEEILLENRSLRELVSFQRNLVYT